MSNSRHHDPAKREAAIADYYASNDTAVVVAARHGIPRATFAGWVELAFCIASAMNMTWS